MILTEKSEQTEQNPIIENDVWPEFFEDSMLAGSSDGAVVLRNMRFWLRKNLENDRAGKSKVRHIHDGRVWTFTTIQQLSEKFPWLTTSKIRTIMAALEEKGMVVTGNYGNPFQRAKWYSLNDPEFILDGEHENQEHKTTEKPEKRQTAKKPQKPPKTAANPRRCRFVKNEKSKCDNPQMLQILKQTDNKKERESEPELTLNDLINIFMADSLGLLFGRQVLKEFAFDYLCFCRTRGAVPSLSGFRRKLQAQAEQEERRAITRLAADNLAEARADKLSALAIREQERADQLHFQNAQEMLGNAAGF